MATPSFITFAVIAISAMPPGADAKIMVAVGKARVFDLKNKLVAVITFDAEKDQRYGYLSSFIMGSGDNVDPTTGVSPHRRDLIRVEIHTLNTTDEYDSQFKDENHTSI